MVKTEEILVSYTGPFHIDVLVLIASNIKRVTQKHKHACLKLHKIFIELGQNIASYSASTQQVDEQEVGTGLVELLEDDEAYYFKSSNKVKNEDGTILMNRCELINSLDRHGLRDLKREKRLHSEKIKLNAHIGIIHAALLSDNQITYELIPVDDFYSFFSITVKIDKN